MKPQAGEWYKQDGVTQAFKVVSYDKKGDWIEIFYADGTIEEMTFGDWHDLVEEDSLTKIPSPGSFDDEDLDDLEEERMQLHGPEDDE